MSELKGLVKDHWEEAPCYSPIVRAPRGTAKYFHEHELARYRLEPYIPAFAQFDSHAGQHVLEIGYGPGTDFVQFARGGAMMVGIDLTEAGAEHVTSRLAMEDLKGTVVVGDAEHLPFASDRFDLVYSWGVLHHTPDTERAIREAVRVLRPGGRLRLMLYNRRSIVALQAWFRFGLLRGRPGMGIREALWHVESPGTKGYTPGEIAEMIGPMRELSVETIVTKYDLRVWHRVFLPWAFKWVIPRRFGWLHLVRGLK